MKYRVWFNNGGEMDWYDATTESAEAAEAVVVENGIDPFYILLTEEYRQDMPKHQIS